MKFLPAYYIMPFKVVYTRFSESIVPEPAQYNVFCRKYSKLTIWKSNTKVSATNESFLYDGVHHSHEALFWDTQILLNYLCNNNNQTHFNDASCCVSPEVMTSSQKALLCLLIWW